MIGRRWSRRDVLRTAGGLGGVLGAGSLLGAADLGRSSGASAETSATRALPARTATAHDGEHGGAHGAFGTTGTVDHDANGFDPHTLLTDFDGGDVSRDRSGRTVREYQFDVVARPIEVAPGVMFDAWTYNGRVPGPTIRATEGDRIRVRLRNGTPHHHSVHFHGFHPAAMDGVPGAGEVGPGEEFTYDFIAGPFGTHLYHCHAFPLANHIHRGLYGAFIVDPPGGRPNANEMVFVLNGFDTNFDRRNEVYAANTIAFAYMDRPIPIERGRLQRAHVINMTEFDPLNSIHLHATFFSLFRTGTRLVPDELTDIVTMGQAERHMIEFTYEDPGTYMFHAHQTEFAELGWMSAFAVS